MKYVPLKSNLTTFHMLSFRTVAECACRRCPKTMASTTQRTLRSFERNMENRNFLLQILSRVVESESSSPRNSHFRAEPFRFGRDIVGSTQLQRTMEVLPA